MMNIRPRLAALAVLLLAPGVRAEPAAPKSPALTVSSFAKVAADTDALLAGKTPSPATQGLFKSYDNTAHAYTRNPECIAARVDLSCVSVANSANADGTGGNRGCVTMITPLHGVTNSHFGQPYAPGVVHYFVDRANAVYPRKIVSSATVNATDIQVVTFDTPLPASVPPAQLLAATAVRLLPPGTPLLSTNQQKHVVITELGGFSGGELVVLPAAAPSRRAWTTSPPAVIGDSDSPTFVLLDGRPRLLCTFHTNMSGPTLSDNFTAIRSLLGGKYALDAAALR